MSGLAILKQSFLDFLCPVTTLPISNETVLQDGLMITLALLFPEGHFHLELLAKSITALHPA